MEGASEHKLKCYHLGETIEQMKIEKGVELANQAKMYKEIVEDHKNAIEKGEQTFEDYRNFM